MNRILAPLFVIFLLLPINALSQGYISAAYGVSDIDFSFSGFDYEESFFDDADSWTLAGGYKVSDYFAVEASYYDSGKFKIKELPSVWVKGDAFDLGIVGIWPVSANFRLFARAGYMQWEAKNSFGDKDDGHDYNFGVGAEYGFNDRFSLFADYRHFQFDDDAGPEDIKVKTISIGVKVYF